MTDAEIARWIDRQVARARWRRRLGHVLRVGVIAVAVAAGVYTCATTKLDPQTTAFLLGLTVGQASGR